MISEINGDFLQWLRGFFYTAQQESVSRAAAIMGRGQSSVSHHIACLEREMGAKLFDRAHGRMTLTPEGKKLRERAISIFETIEEMRADLNPGKGELSGRVAITTTHAVLLYFLPRHISGFMELHPQVNFDLDGGGLEHILSKVEAAESDFGIASLDSVPSNLEFRPLFKTRPMLITPIKNPWGLDGDPALEDIARCPFIAFPTTSTITSEVEKRFITQGLSLNRVLVLNNFELVKKYVELGLGVAILDEYAIQRSDENALRVLALDRYFNERTYGIISRQRGYVPPAAKAFIRSIMAAG
jgi:LysR family cyn operon transcriptional activator